MQAGKRGRFMKLSSSNVCLMKGCGSPRSNATAARSLVFHLGDTGARRIGPKFVHFWKQAASSFCRLLRRRDGEMHCIPEIFRQVHQLRKQFAPHALGV